MKIKISMIVMITMILVKLLILMMMKIIFTSGEVYKYKQYEQSKRYINKIIMVNVTYVEFFLYEVSHAAKAITN